MCHLHNAVVAMAPAAADAATLPLWSGMLAVAVSDGGPPADCLNTLLRDRTGAPLSVMTRGVPGSTVATGRALRRAVGCPCPRPPSCRSGVWEWAQTAGKNPSLQAATHFLLGDPQSLSATILSSKPCFVGPDTQRGRPPLSPCSLHPYPPVGSARSPPHVRLWHPERGDSAALPPPVLR